MQTIKIGDKVNWRGNLGKDTPKKVTVKDISWHKGGNFQKNFFPKTEILLPAKDWCIFTFKENNQWAYGHQIDIIELQTNNN